MGMYCTSLWYVSGGQIGDSLVVRAIKQLRRVVVSGGQPLVGCLGLVDNSNVQQKYKMLQTAAQQHINI
jgi:hypothetical protein